MIEKDIMKQKKTALMEEEMSSKLFCMSIALLLVTLFIIRKCVLPKTADLQYLPLFTEHKGIK